MRRVAFVAVLMVVTSISACDVPLFTGLPSTRALEDGAVDSLTGAKSFEITGSYTDSEVRWSIDLQVVRPSTQHLVAKAPNITLEAITIDQTTYYRGQDFLAAHVGSDPISQSLVRAAGNGWWTGPVAQVVRLSEFTVGSYFRLAFLGPVASRRTDHVNVDGVQAVELSGIRADVYIAAVAPYQVLRVHLNKGVKVDGMTDADLSYGGFNRDFAIAAPPNVIDFSNLSTLPPIYVVISVDTSRCGSPCAVSAVLKNVGGQSAARAPSSVSFSVSDAASGSVVGGCSSQISPDVGYNGTTSVGCTIGDLNGQQLNAAIVSATVDNPGRA